MIDRQRQRAVGTRLDDQPAIRCGQGLVHVDIDRRDAGLRRLFAADVTPDLQVVVVGSEGLEEVAAEHQQVIGVAVIVGVVRVVAVGGSLCMLRTGSADRGMSDGDVGRAIELAEGALQTGAGSAPAAAVEQRESVRLTLVAQGIQAPGDRIQRLVPGDRYELGILIAPLLRIGALHRTLKAVRVVEDVGTEVALGA
jgi:hypothetical protein